MKLDVTVCGPGQIPVITDPARFAADPQLGTLSLMAHGDQEPVGKAFMAAAESIGFGNSTRYYEHAHMVAPPLVKRVLEVLMSAASWPVSTPFAQQHYGAGKAEGIAEGKAEGIAEGKAEGIAEGKAEGKVEGEALGKAKAVATILESRGLTVTAEQRTRIENTRDHPTLDTWIREAPTVASTAELLDRYPPP